MNLTIHQIAKIAYEVNRAYCTAIGDHSQPKWEDAPEWQRKSATNGVIAHLEKALSPAESHALWLKEKQDAGWKYGEYKDLELKRHPCCVPYDQLPLQERVKDYLFAAVVAALKGD